MEKLTYSVCIPTHARGRPEGRVPKESPPPDCAMPWRLLLISPHCPQKPSPPCWVLCLRGGQSSPRSLSPVVAHNSPGTERVFKPLFPKEERWSSGCTWRSTCWGALVGVRHVTWMKPFRHESYYVSLSGLRTTGWRQEA